MEESSRSSRLVPPRIDTSGSLQGGQKSYSLYDPSPSNTPLGSPRLPSVRVSSSPNDIHDVFSNSPNATSTFPPVSNAASRAKSESRKLLVHLLYQLLNRRRPPPIAQTLGESGDDPAQSRVGPLSGLIREVASIQKAASKSSFRGAESDEREGSDTEQDEIFSTEATFELMTQLQDLLVMSKSMGWQLFDEEYAPRPYLRPFLSSDPR